MVEHRTNSSSIVKRWLNNVVQRPVVTLTVATVLCLLPFVNKPFHIDDPMYLWAAQQIAEVDPCRFYDFKVNWDGTPREMADINKNPPLASYYMAMAGRVIGWHEAGLHLWFMVPAIGLVIGTWRLATLVCDQRQSLLAAATTLTMPVVIVSASTLMSDVLMSCLWVWVMVLWEMAMRQQRWSIACLAAGGAGLAALTKFPAINLPPLMFVHALLQPRFRRAIITLVIPVGMLLGYEAVVRSMFEQGHVLRSAEWSLQLRTTEHLPLRIMVGLSFLGGCFAPALFLAPWLWSRWGLVIGAAAIVLMALQLGSASDGMLDALNIHSRNDVMLLIQVATWMIIGLGIVIITIQEAAARRDRMSMTLAFWIIGTLAFACVVNWSTNGRSLLPAAPAVAVVLVQRIARLQKDRQTDPINYCWASALVPAFALTLVVAAADYSLARAGKRAAEVIGQLYSAHDQTVWFEGHWGFQHYAQQWGALAVDLKSGVVRQGDLVILPGNGDGVRWRFEGTSTLQRRIVVPTFSWMSTMNFFTGAGFYSDVWGPLPFAVRAGPAETYSVVRIDQTWNAEEARAATSKPQ